MASTQPGSVAVRVSRVQTTANISHRATIHRGSRLSPRKSISPASAQQASRPQPAVANSRAGGRLAAGNRSQAKMASVSQISRPRSRNITTSVQ